MHLLPRRYMCDMFSSDCCLSVISSFPVGPDRWDDELEVESSGRTRTEAGGRRLDNDQPQTGNDALDAPAVVFGLVAAAVKSKQHESLIQQLPQVSASENSWFTLTDLSHCLGRLRVWTGIVLFAFMPLCFL